MKYQVMNHNYENTGGNTMVSTFEIYDMDKVRTLFLHINEDGGTLTTVNIIGTDIELIDEMEVGGFYKDSLQPTDKYFELFRDCFIEYVKKDAKYFGMEYQLQLNQLNDKLLEQLTEDYIEWMKAEGHDTVLTDGYKICIDEEYEAVKEERQNRLIMIAALNAFQQSYFDLLLAWSSCDLNNTYTIGDYPFDESFDELRIADWCDSAVAELEGK